MKKKNCLLHFSTKTTTANAFDLKCVNALATAIEKSKKVRHKINKEIWAHHFSLMRTRDRLKKKRIRKVLDWYAMNIGRKFVPEAFSAISFRKKFLRIEMAMGRTIQRPLERNDLLSVPDEEEISEEVNGILHSAMMHNWPKDSGKDVPKTIQLSLNGYAEFKRKHVRLHSAAKKHDLGLSAHDHESLNAFCEYVTQRLEPETYFVSIWIDEVNRMIAEWEDWEGPLTNMRFQFKSRWFQKRMAKYSIDYCGSSRLWNLYNSEFIEL